MNKKICSAELSDIRTITVNNKQLPMQDQIIEYAPIKMPYCLQNRKSIITTHMDGSALKASIIKKMPNCKLRVKKSSKFCQNTDSIWVVIGRVTLLIGFSMSVCCEFVLDNFEIWRACNA